MISDIIFGSEFTLSFENSSGPHRINVDYLSMVSFPAFFSISYPSQKDWCRGVFSFLIKIMACYLTFAFYL